LKDSTSSQLIPTYEHQRLEALRPYQVLSQPGQSLFNDFVGVVAKLFDVPIALMSLVRQEDVVFVGNTGLPEAQVVNREDSMCSVAILQEEVTVYEDIATKPCELVNPLIAKEMQLGFYAGQSLRAPNGMGIGTLCVLDHKARQLTTRESELLQELGLVAEELLRLKATVGANTPQVKALRLRMDAIMHQSLTRLNTLTELGKWDITADGADLERYNLERLEEAKYLAQVMHRELQAALSEFTQAQKPSPVR
jgi:hypothetical protein